jgi:hypothetical protein
MKKLFFPAVLALAVSTSFVWAQNITQGLQGSQDPRFIGMDANKNVYWPSHMLWSTTGAPLAGTPVLSACITGGTPTIVGTDWVGQINAGSTASTSCVVTFTQAYAAAPTCFVTWSSGPLAAMSWTTSTTALTITQTSNASSVIEYQCTGAK